MMGLMGEQGADLDCVMQVRAALAFHASCIIFLFFLTTTMSMGIRGRRRRSVLASIGGLRGESLALETKRKCGVIWGA